MSELLKPLAVAADWILKTCAVLVLLWVEVAAADMTTLRGQVSFHERLALPPGAVVQVALVDVSRADAPAIPLARQQVEGAIASPIPFELTFDRARIEAGRSYALQARILVNGELWFINTSRHAIFDGGPDNTDILVQRVAAGPSLPPFGTWLAESIGGGGVLDRLQSTLEITPDGRAGGNGGCNRFTGRATIEGDAIAFGEMASTRMACSPAVMDQEAKFHAALRAAKRFQTLPQQRKLLLFDANGNIVLRLTKL